VLREQFGIRLQPGGVGATSSGNEPGAGPSTAVDDGDPPQEVSPEFLAALPEEVQREVYISYFT